jgi:hypothetical protein
MDAETEARVLAEFPGEGAQIVALARSLMGAPPPQPSAAPVEVAITKSDGEKAGGTPSAVVNAKLIREACAGLSEAAARETV